ncbi:hypothetical protein KFU94_00900 [Chloroflexi bacterium TSY]|nr:hypothetical protein [Chloroflexi bacterium TSY]
MRHLVPDRTPTHLNNPIFHLIHPQRMMERWEEEHPSPPRVLIPLSMRISSASTILRQGNVPGQSEPLDTIRSEQTGGRGLRSALTTAASQKPRRWQ